MELILTNGRCIASCLIEGGFGPSPIILVDPVLAEPLHPFKGWALVPCICGLFARKSCIFQALIQLAQFCFTRDDALRSNIVNQVSHQYFKTICGEISPVPGLLARLGCDYKPNLLRRGMREIVRFWIMGMAARPNR